MSIESRSRQYGKVFDHWQIKEFLGSGSGGKTAVFRLVRSDSGWGVSALKIVNLIEERGDIESLSNYQRQEYIHAREERSRNAEQEVRLMDALRGNTNIVDYLDHTFVDWSDDTGFGRDMLIRMELLNDLRNDIRSGKIFSEAEILKIGHDICVALVLCHRKNILHRDIKPENIFQNKDGNYKLGDFGVSRVLDACPDAVASTGIGTFEYGPAEQMTGRYDKRVDIYSLGLVLYELSNDNRLPFAASTYVTGKEVSKRLSGVLFPRPSNASPALCKVILKACAFNPDERYQSAAEFLRDINMVRRKARGDIPRKLPQQEDVKAASGEDSKDDYATVLAKELGLPENLFIEDAYHTVPASANEVEGKAAPREKSYATEPAGKTPPVYHSAADTSGKRRRSKKYLIALIPIVTLLGLGIGILSARIVGYHDTKPTDATGHDTSTYDTTNMLNGVGANTEVSMYSADNAIPTESLVTATKHEEYYNPLNGEMISEPFNKRIFASVIGNSEDDLPHIGVTEADVIFESFVNRNDVIRCLALYSNIENVEAIGSIRGTRPIFHDIAQHYGLLLTYSGGSEQVLADAEQRNVEGFDVGLWEASSKGTSYYEEVQGRAPSNSLVGIGSGIYSYAESQGFNMSLKRGYGLNFTDNGDGKPNDGIDAEEINIVFTYDQVKKETIMHYEPSTNKYFWKQYGMAMKDLKTGEDEKFTNIIVMYTQISHESIYYTANFPGGGIGYYANGGKAVPINWKCKDEYSPFSFLTIDGEPLKIGAGNTYIAIVPLESTVTFDGATLEIDDVK